MGGRWGGGDTGMGWMTGMTVVALCHSFFLPAPLLGAADDADAQQDQPADPEMAAADAALEGQEQLLPITIEEAWAFFSTPANLNEITPADLGFVITSTPEPNAVARQPKCKPSRCSRQL